MENKNNKEKEGNFSESDRKKLAALTIGVGVASVAATGSTIGVVVDNVVSYNEKNVANDEDNTDEVIVDEQDISEVDSVSDEGLVVVSENIIEVDEETLVDTLEEQEIDSLESEDRYIDDISNDEDLPIDSLDDLLI